MVTILPKFDPGAEIGQSFGSGLTNALNLLGERKLAQSALDRLSEIDTSQMTAPQIVSEVGKATVGLPNLQRQAAQYIEMLLNEKRAKAAQESAARRAIGTRDLAAQQRQPAQPQPEEGQSQQFLGEGEQALGQPQAMAAMQRGMPGQEPQPRDLRQIPQSESMEVGQYFLSPQAIDQIRAPFLEVGDVAGANQAQQRAEDQLIRMRQQEIEMAQQRNAERAAQRELEKEVAADVVDKTSKLLEKNGVAGNPEQWNRISVNLFEQERAKPENRGKSEQALWNEAGRKIERKINDIATSAQKNFRPIIRGNQKERFQQARKWATGHLREYGNTDEDRELLKSILMNSGWSRREATGIVQPFSEALESGFKKAPRMELKMERPGIFPDRRGLFEDNKEEAVASLRESFKPSDSLLLLKTKLVLEKGYSDREANEIIDEVTKGMRLQPHQNREQSYMMENTRPSILEIMTEDRTVMEALNTLVQ